MNTNRRTFLKTIAGIVAGGTYIAVAGTPEPKTKIAPFPVHFKVLKVRVKDEKFRIVTKDKEYADIFKPSEYTIRTWKSEWLKYPGDGVIPDWWGIAPINELTEVYVEAPDGSRKPLRNLIDENGYAEPVVIHRYRSLKRETYET